MPNRESFINSLRQLAETTKEAGELPAAGVLFALCAAMVEGREMELFALTVPFAAAQYERLTGGPDWGDDTLKV